MHLLSLIAGGFAALCIGIGVIGWEPTYIGLGVVGLMLAAATFSAQRISSFLKIFSAVFAAEYVLFGLVHLAGKYGFWPDALKALIPPFVLPLTVAIFGILIWSISHIPVIRSITRLSDPYFEDRTSFACNVLGITTIRLSEQLFARVMIGFLVVLNQAQVGFSVRLSFFNRDWFNAIEKKDQAAFWSLLVTVWLLWVSIYIVSNLIETVAQNVLYLRWRRWLTERLSMDWLRHGTQYRISLLGKGADNPDQRISEDVKNYLEKTYSFSISLISQISSLVSFSVILWSISANFTIPGTDIVLPGFLFWVALIYAAIGTTATHYVGRALIPLNFAQEKYEADFRFGLARIREYNEQIALLRGERVEVGGVMERFGWIMTNTMKIVYRKIKLFIVIYFYNYSSAIIPYVVVAPFYFAGKVTLGVMSQTASAFSSVATAMSFFIDRYTSLADYKAVLDRLTTFDAAIREAQPGQKGLEIAHATVPADGLAIRNLKLRLPDGRDLVNVPELSLRRGESVLVTGPSGSGKSTLFRAIAGIWPFGAGSIEESTNARVMLLPQRPYIPIGDLRGAVSYPENSGAYPDAAIESALQAVRLGHLAAKLGEVDLWSQRLSGGEQQRLAIARALLAKPDWLFLDEATASLDEPLEAAIYAAIDEHLPDTTVVSIGHRSTLIAMHDRQIVMEPEDGGTFSPRDRMATAMPGQ